MPADLDVLDVERCQLPSQVPSSIILASIRVRRLARLFQPHVCSIRSSASPPLINLIIGRISTW